MNLALRRFSARLRPSDARQLVTMDRKARANAAASTDLEEIKKGHAKALAAKDKHIAELEARVTTLSGALREAGK